MNQDEKLKYFESVQKDLTSFCFEQCFKTKKFSMDKQCVQNCYQKYVYSLNQIGKEVIELGREVQSDFVVRSVQQEKKDRFADEIFPIGGHPHQTREGAVPWRRYFSHSYQFKPNDQSGR